MWQVAEHLFLSPVMLGLTRLTTWKGGCPVSDFCLTSISLSEVCLSSVYCTLFSSMRGMKTKLHYSSSFLVSSDTKLLAACRACSTSCKLTHEGAVLQIQDAWNRQCGRCWWVVDDTDVFLWSGKVFLSSQHSSSCFAMQQTQPPTICSGHLCSVHSLYLVLLPCP